MPNSRSPLVVLANLTRGEFIEPMAFGDGATLNEVLEHPHGFLHAAMHLLHGDWAGDQAALLTQEQEGFDAALAGEDISLDVLEELLAPGALPTHVEDRIRSGLRWELAHGCLDGWDDARRFRLRELLRRSWPPEAVV